MKTTLYQTLLATAVGDAYGLPYENLSPRRAKKWLRPRHYALLPFIHGGMVSDDTEHAVLTVQAYIASAGEPNASAQIARTIALVAACFARELWHGYAKRLPENLFGFAKHRYLVGR